MIIIFSIFTNFFVHKKRNAEEGKEFEMKQEDTLDSIKSINVVNNFFLFLSIVGARKKEDKLEVLNEKCLCTYTRPSINVSNDGRK